MKKNKSFYYSLFAVIITVIIAYSNHFQNEFHFDDFHTIVNNGAIRKISNIPQFFTDARMFSASPTHQTLRPLVTSTLAIDYWMGNGFTLFWFHLTNFLWHIGLCIILFFLYKKLLSTYINHKWINFFALFGAAWFGLHTAMAETVNYIISRSDILSTFFIILSLYIFAAFPEKRKWYLYLIPAALATMAKETAPMLIVLLFFYILFFEKNLSIGDLFKKGNFKTIGQTIIHLLPVTLIVLLLQFYTLSSASSDVASFGLSNPLIYYWLTQCYVWFFYFKSFFLPTHLSADTDFKVIQTIWDSRVLIGIVFMALLVIATIKLSSKNSTRPIAYGLIWFGASLIPTSIAPLSEVMNDHRMYFAFTGLSLSVVAAIAVFIMNKVQYFALKQVRKAALFSGAFLILFMNAYGVYQRNKVWHTEGSLWYDVTQKSPDNGRGWMNYGLTKMEKGNYSEAYEIFKKAQALLPAYNLIYVNLGIVSGELKKFEEADNYFRAGIALAPNSAAPYAYFAQYLAKNGRINEAKEMTEKALLLNPVDNIALNTQMAVYQSLQMWPELEKAANNKLSLYPGDKEALNYLASAKTKSSGGQIGDIKLATRPTTADDYISISLAMYNLGKYEECIKAGEDALKLNPNSAEAYNNICAANCKLGQWEKARQACEKALQINPDLQLAKGNLEWAKREGN
ncbi:MAG TPA: tetratricopeptide repeat protein [Niabella sp.]|nr:tetratricopeptide repeat protein [Niabella sp.]